MNGVKIVAGLLAAGVAAGASAAPLLLSEGFDDVATLAASGWVFTNASTPVGLSWFQGNSGIFGAQSGAADAYVGANFNSTTADDGVVDNWLISPELSVGAGSTLTFYTRASDAGYLDLLEVRFASGSSSALSGFSTLLGTVGDAAAASYPIDDWAAYTLTLPTATSGRFALHYSVANALDASYIGIDSVTVTAVNAIPEPATLLIVGLGLAVAFGAQRRRASIGPQLSV